MPQNLTQIANSALIKLGADTVASISDSTRSGSLVRERIVSVIHRVLREHTWNFATVITTLSPDATTPPPGEWTYSFLVPVDCVRIRSVDTEDYEVALTNDPVLGYRGRHSICTNKDSITVRYTSRIIDSIESPALFPDDFADAVAAFLAYEISPALTSSLPMREDLMALANRLLAFARFNGSVEVPQYKLNESSWLDSRLTWNGSNDDRRVYPLDI